MLEFANGRVERADLVVGADGVRSTVRRWVTGADDAVYSGTSAFRGIVPTENLPSLPDPHAIQFWMGPDAHLLHYAIGGNGESVNFFAVVETPKIWLHPGSIADVHEELPVASFRGWHPAVTEMIQAAASPDLLGAVHRASPAALVPGPRGHPRRRRPRHAPPPRPGRQHLHRGCLRARRAARRRESDDLTSTFSRFQTLRRTRTRKIQRSSRVTSSLLHLPDGPAAQARNGKVAGCREDFGWIHEYDVQQELQKIGCTPAHVPGRHQVDLEDSTWCRTRYSTDIGDVATTFASIAGVDPAEVTPDKSIARSRHRLLTMLEAIVALEDRFGLLIPDDDWPQFATVGDLVAHLERVSPRPE